MVKYAFMLLIFVLFNLAASPGSASMDPFPVYSCIKPNVAFWLDIYTRYDLTEGVLHDNSDLSIVYGKIPLIHPDEPGAGKINEQRIKQAKKKCHDILSELYRSSQPLSAEAQRIRSLFGENCPPERYKQAQDQLRCQTGQKSRFLKGLIRSGAYLDEFRNIFTAQGLPGDLVYLAHVESSFDINATSSCGAAGIWQFMPATARRFMQVNDVLDERRDPFIATKAAAAYLKENHGKLDSWPLALTAYNHGVNGMLRAKRQKGEYDQVYAEYCSPSFGFASRNFYPCFLAAREAAANHEKYFGDIELTKPVQTVAMTMPGYANLKNVVRKLGVEVETIRELNPALRPSVYRGQKYIPRGYRLMVPAPGAVSSDVVLAQMPTGIFRNEQKRDRIHVVQKGDTAFRIARKHNVGLSDLISANNLCRQAVIRPGQSLKIPHP